jgi:hypothetical protein
MFAEFVQHFSLKLQHMKRGGCNKRHQIGMALTLFEEEGEGRWDDVAPLLDEGLSGQISTISSCKMPLIGRSTFIST